MKIVGIETYRVDVSVAPVRWREGLPVMPAVSEDVWIRVLTDEGIDGWSPMEYWGPVTEHLVDRWLRDLAVGRNPLMKEDLFHRVWELDRLEALPKYVIGVLDVACWDITAKVAGLPLYLLLGGAREKIAAYASTVTFATLEEYLDVADQCRALGFGAIKLHAWGDARRDADLCLRLRDHVGPEVALMYDGSAAFGAADALYVGRACEEAGYLWLEEPMREFLVGSYRRLCDQLEIAVLAPENLEGAHYAVAEFLASGATDLARTGTHTQGGVTGALRIAHLADAFGTTAEVHGGGLPNLHLCCGVRNTTYYESIVANPVVREAGIDAEGFIAAPNTPGIGVDAEAEALMQR